MYSISVKVIFGEIPSPNNEVVAVVSVAIDVASVAVAVASVAVVLILLTSLLFCFANI